MCRLRPGPGEFEENLPAQTRIRTRAGLGFPVPGPVCRPLMHSVNYEFFTKSSQEIVKIRGNSFSKSTSFCKLEALHLQNLEFSK
jgi:hypothetical protein